jgi:nitrogenase molybdenum-iron protein alpha/beta subunit
LKDELEGFALSSHSYGRITGVSLAMHSIPDAFLVLHTGVGCKYKGAGQYCLHDLARPSHHREGYTEVTDLALIKGSASRIPIYVRSWHKKRNPAFMAVVSSTFLEMAGEDFAKAAREAESTVPCPVAYVKTLGFDGDLYDGYNSLALEVLRRVPFKKTKPVPGRVGVVGYVFDRYEMDHAGNLQQLRFLLESLGLECGPVVLSGRPYKELMGLASCERLILLPYGRVYAKELSKLSGRPVIQTDLPVGLSGTFRWLQDVAKGCGVAKPVVEACIKRQSDYARPQMDSLRTYARQRLGSRRIALFAETPLAAGLASFAAEAGLSPALVGLRDRSLGGRKAFLEAVGRTGVKPPEDLEVLENPSLSLSVQKVSALRDRGQLSLVVGSCTELSYINPEGRQNEVPSVELGFPSFNYHVLFPTPYYGVAGALALAQRVMNQVR